MTLYRNLNGKSGVLSYEMTEDSIHVVFRFGTCRNYLYNHTCPGRDIVDRMKILAGQGAGLGSYIITTVKSDFYKKW
jgi:hypothetical protein